eukprot:TRINITY_DN14705_c0_g1_i3.p1 TRINITY_DN14705_c0_g1~~TRINITY_DN14705_c0_g1_i3.p1  ORF type:complete len:274 (+),score=31.98 TRINITY_DN14705_c0_g1_i3:34-855(+)
MGNQGNREARESENSGRPQLRVICHNIAGHWFSPNDPPNLKGRLQAFSDEIERARIDVVMVQELYTFSVLLPSWSRELDFFDKRLRSLGFAYSTLNGEDSSRRWLGMDAGLRVWSRVPIVSSLVRPFETSSPSFGASYKGYQCVQLDWNGAPLLLVNTHCSWKQSDQPAAQFECLEQVGTQHAADPNATVVMAGDFNQRPHTGFLRRDGFVPLAPRGVSTHDDDMELDHAFVRMGKQFQGCCEAESAQVVRWETSNGEALSDHRGLMFQLTTS